LNYEDSLVETSSHYRASSERNMPLLLFYCFIASLLKPQLLI